MVKVLVIEDNPVNMELVTDLLETRGHEVQQAGTAEEGIETAKRRRPDIILMDIALPGIDGLTATGLLKQNPQTKSIPVIALTAHAMHGDAEKAMAAGCAGYITKPINTREFAVTVEQFVLSGTDRLK
jgi:two-component system cell cycle response regulator DivK